MLDFIYYPVSWILWVWHKAFSFVLAPDSGLAWTLSVVFLVFTLRAILYKPFVKQVRTTRQMQELQPQIKALQKKYSNDRQRQATEMQKLQKEHGFNPLMGCLPMLLQVPCSSVCSMCSARSTARVPVLVSSVCHLKRTRSSATMPSARMTSSRS